MSRSTADPGGSDLSGASASWKSADVTVIVCPLVSRWAGTNVVVLLHGQPGSARDWDLVLRDLAGHTPVLAVDRPGYDGISEPGGIEHSASAMIARMDAEGIERATIAGLSFGGGVAAWLAAHHPDRVHSLVLISAAANRAALYPLDRLLAAPVAGRVASGALVSGAGLALGSRRLRGRFASRHGVPEEFLHATGERLRTRAARRAFLVEQRAMLRELPVLEERLATISVPTTVVVGTADTVVGANSGRALARQIPGAILVEIEGARHTLTATHAPRIAELILAASVVTGVEHGVAR
jgi:3-oxoadipate enol-lactonase / 4-carboxymuconolactone decarboxylase